MYNEKRRVVTYLNTKYTALFVGHCYDQGEDKTRIASKIMKIFYDELPLEEQIKLLITFIEMDEENKKAEYGKESTVMKKIFRHFFNTLPEQKQKRLLKMYEEMSDEEKQRPGKR